MRPFIVIKIIVPSLSADIGTVLFYLSGLMYTGMLYGIRFPVTKPRSSILVIPAFIHVHVSIRIQLANILWQRSRSEKKHGDSYTSSNLDF